MTMPRPALWVELCAGSAAVTLRLVGGAGARPPVAYIGSKRAYARAILNVMGPHSGDGSDAVLLVEAGPWAKVWASLVQPNVCAEVVRILRSWKDEDPKALWDRLKADPIPKDPAGYTAAWTFLQARNFSAVQVGEGVGGFDVAGFKSETPADGSARWKTSEPDAADVAKACASAGEWAARWLWLNGRSFGSKGESFGFDGDRGFNPSQVEMARAVAGVGRIPWAGVDPAHVAQWIFQQGASYGGLFGSGAAGFNYRSDHDVMDMARDAVRAGGVTSPALGIIQADVRDIRPPDPLPDPTYVYMDPPYQDVTGYQHSLPRDAVIAVARMWSDAGAVVCVSEDDPLPIDGWHHVDITECFTGTGRTFSRSRVEWLTINRPPAWTPPVQVAWTGLTTAEDVQRAQAHAAEQAAQRNELVPPPQGPGPARATQTVLWPAPAKDGQIDMFGS